MWTAHHSAEASPRTLFTRGPGIGSLACSQAQRQISKRTKLYGQMAQNVEKMQMWKWPKFQKLKECSVLWIRVQGHRTTLWSQQQHLGACLQYLGDYSLKHDWSLVINPLREVQIIRICIQQKKMYLKNPVSISDFLPVAKLSRVFSCLEYRNPFSIRILIGVG